MVPANAVDAPSPGDLSLLPPPSFVGRRNLPPASGRTVVFLPPTRLPQAGGRVSYIAGWIGRFGLRLRTAPILLKPERNSRARTAPIR